MGDSVVGAGYVDKAILFDMTGQSVWGKAAEIEVHTLLKKIPQLHPDLCSKIDDSARDERHSFRL